MNKYKLLIEYEGTEFVGWQKQKNGLSIQESIENSIKKLSGEQIVLYAAGRTDAGVHALGQVAHFEIKKDFSEDNIRDGINNYLSKLPISIINATKADKNFHARFSAKQRIYEYLIINRRSPLTYQKKLAWIIFKKLNLKKIKEAKNFFLGKHDFESFRSINCQSSSSIKTIDKFEINTNGESIIINISAKSFLQSQVRIMVGSLVDVGTEKIEPKEIKNIIKIRDRSKAGSTAPPHGLYLKEVIY